MEPALGVALCWALFGGTHIGLGLPRVRRPLVARLGEWGFTLAFSAVAAASFTLLVRTYALHAAEGAAGLGWAGVPGVGLACLGAIWLGFALILPPSPSTRAPRWRWAAARARPRAASSG